jgi:hypothetical protein
MAPTDPELDPQILRNLGGETITAEAEAALSVGPIRLTPQEFTLVSALSRNYRKHFGQRLDVEQFVANDLYARVVLQESHKSGNPALAQLAAQFLDQNGMPRFQLGRGRDTLDLEF